MISENPRSIIYTPLYKNSKHIFSIVWSANSLLKSFPHCTHDYNNKGGDSEILVIIIILEKN
jgi:hypothetical protein